MGSTKVEDRGLPSWFQIAAGYIKPNPPSYLNLGANYSPADKGASTVIPASILALIIQESPLVFDLIKSLIAIKKSHPKITQEQITALWNYATTMDDGTRAIILADQAQHP